MKTITIDGIEYELVAVKKESAKPTAKERLIEIIQSVNRPFLIDERFPDRINFFRDNDFMFQIDNSIFFCVRPSVWHVFENEYSMEYSEIEDLIKKVLEETFKIKRMIPWKLEFISVTRLEETFKIK